MGLLRRLFGILVHPGRTFAGIVREERLWSTLGYFAALLLVPGAILVAAGAVVYPLYFAPWLGEQQALGWIGVIAIVPLILATALVGLAVGGLVLEPFVLLFGGGRGYRQTLKALVYGWTPLVLSLWLPPLVPFAAIWSLLLVVIGVRRTRGMSGGRAALAVLLPKAILLILFVAIGLAASLRAA